jgi:hypothetical protein
MFGAPAVPPEATKDARLFSDRIQMIKAIGPAKARRVVEIGVAFGEFSEQLIARYKPDEFHAIDVFDLHTYPTLWGHPSENAFKGATHQAFYDTRIAAVSDRATSHQGNSFDVMETFPDKHFDLIYIDASHKYEDVKRDAEVSVRKLTAGGMIIFNDYIYWSHGSNEPFGVVQVVNDMLANQGWKIAGFALHPEMYCDVALVRPNRRSPNWSRYSTPGRDLFRRLRQYSGMS